VDEKLDQTEQRRREVRSRQMTGRQWLIISHHH
jgi:hypothetical protein